MYADELDGYMSQYPCFCGTLALDQLFLIESRIFSQHHSCFIVNTQSSVYGGEHWIACMRLWDHVEIFDPYGIPPPIQLFNFVSQFSNVIQTNTIQVQPSFYNFDCGLFCLYYLLHRHDDFKGSISSFVKRHFSVHDFDSIVSLVNSIV